MAFWIAMLRKCYQLMLYGKMRCIFEPNLPWSDGQLNVLHNSTQHVEFVHITCCVENRFTPWCHNMRFKVIDYVKNFLPSKAKKKPHQPQEYLARLWHKETQLVCCIIKQNNWNNTNPNEKNIINSSFSRKILWEVMFSPYFFIILWRESIIWPERWKQQ